MAHQPNYNRWGEETNSPEDLPVDEWFPSEARERGDLPHSAQTAVAVVSTLIGALMLSVATGFLIQVVTSPTPSPGFVAICVFFCIWGASLFVPYSILLYYRVRRLFMLNRTPPGGDHLTVRDIDQYSVPLFRSWQGAPRFGFFNVGSGRATALTRFARTAGIVLTVLFFLSMVVALLLTAVSAAGRG